MHISVAIDQDEALGGAGVSVGTEKKGRENEESFHLVLQHGGNSWQSIYIGNFTMTMG
jgi:hypothetical protein